ncbi:aldo/keto reductase [Pseudomaricurvus alcaniphilus]|uniref:aldo/keto reductase n=1 Tax=Pseudomaricurvus alcaniphilus TaxID=1166482 RepID=UPI00140B1AFE|nr:aldo/keto reductase [Pseudomaricurvus alcaniphilus]NHN39583.1 aldo/keto reductase [Pseudomaricurvus alcaniphilus]
MYIDKVGLGCASMLGRYGRSDSTRILEHAYGKGIRHYDVARSYGYGEAEALIGKVLFKKEGVLISTKFGVLPSRRAKYFSFAKPIVRPFIKKNVPGSLEVKYQNSNIIDRNLLLNSLDKSLKELRLDSLHRLYIHEPAANWVLSHDLFDALESIKQSGKIEQWGVSGYLDSVNEIAKNETNGRVGLYQTNLNVLSYSQFREFMVNPIESVFSPFHRGYVIQVLEAFRKNKNFVRRFDAKNNVGFLSRSSAFWAISLLVAVTRYRIILATDKIISLDENLTAVDYGLSIEADDALYAIELMWEHSHA